MSSSTSVPLSLTFIGRQPELAQLTAWMVDPGSRLMVLVGPGGIGKTRLAQQAAAQAVFPNGVFFVPLASLLSSDYLIPAIADALHFSFYNREDPSGQLCNYLCEKQLLLILDSFEQAISAVGWITELVQAAPQIKILITTRQQIDIPGERVIHLAGMALPETDAEFDQSPSVSLFLQNARLLNPFYEISPADRPAVRQICEMVGGLPLAIQMAAAWTRAISCQQIAAEIARDMDFLRAPFRSMPERHQSLKAIFDSSWRILPYTERVICRRLSVFCDAIAPEVARDVVGATVEQLNSLAQQSLLQLDAAGRYHFHSTLKPYAAARLAQDVDELIKIRQSHADYFAHFLSERESWLKGGRQAEALQQIADVLGDVRTAWDFLLEQHDFRGLMMAAESLHQFFTIRARPKDGWQVFERAASLCQNDPACPPMLLPHLLSRQATFAIELNEYAAARQLLQNCLDLNPSDLDLAFIHQLLGNLNTLLGDYPQALDHLQLGLEISRRLQNWWGQARALDGLGTSSWTLGDYAGASQFFREALDAYRQLGSQKGIATVLDHLGVVARDQGEHDQARVYFDESLAILRGLESRLSQAYVANHLGGVIAMNGDLAGAEPYFQECIALGREIGERRVVAYTLSDWGSLLSSYFSQPERAGVLLGEAQALFEAMGDQFGLVCVRLGLGNLALKMNDLPAAWQELGHALRLAAEIKNPRLITDALLNVADMLYQNDELERSASLLAFIESRVAPDGNLPQKEQILNHLRERLPEDIFDKALAAGRTYSLEQVVAEFSERKL